MDQNQLSQMVAWLDEEHRREREELSRLDQRLLSLTTENQEQARRIQELEGRLASTQAQLTRFNQIEAALQQLKNEVVAILDKESGARSQSEREAERLRLAERESIARSIAEVRKEVPRIGRVEEELVARQAEDQRLSDLVIALRQAINGLTKDVDDRTRSLPYIVEQRAQDNKRLAQTQGEVVDLLKRTDSFPGKIGVLEERLQRVEREIQRVQPVPTQIRNEQQSFVESQKLADAERDRKMMLWEESFADQRKVIEAQVVRLREFAAQHEASQRAIQALDEFKSRLTHEQKQLSELQRLGEERQRKELAEWQAENEQRWKKEVLRWDYAQQEQQKTNSKLVERFPPIEQALSHLKEELEALWVLQEAVGAQELQNAQRLLDVFSKGIAGRPKPEK